MMDAQLKSLSTNLMNINFNMEKKFNISDHKIQLIDSKTMKSSLETNTIMENITHSYHQQFSDLKSELLTKLADLDKKIIVQNDKIEKEHQIVDTQLKNTTSELEKAIASRRTVIAFRVNATDKKGKPGKILFQVKLY